MTSPVAIIGLVWDGLDLQRSDLDIFFEMTEGLDELPDTRGVDQVIPFRRGRLTSDHIADRRAIVATGWVTGRTPTPTVAFRAYLDSLKARLDPTGPPRLLVATLENGTTRWINAVPRNLIGGVGGASDLRRFSIEWEALDPYWHADWGEWFLDSGLVLDDGWYFNELGYVVGSPTASPFDVTFTALGTATTEAVRVEVDGASAGVVGISNTALSPVVGFTYPALAGGARLVVDSGARTVTLGGVQARGNLTLLAGNEHGEYLRLAPGSNTIRVTGTPAQVRIYFDRSYL